MAALARFRRPLVAWVVLTFAWAGGGCSRQVSSKDLILSIELQARGPGAMVDLGTAAPFDWDRVAIFEPYTTGNQVRDTLGFAWDSQAVAQLGTNDSHDLLLFCKEQRVVAEMRVPAGALDFSRSIVSQSFGRSDARFSVRRDGNGRTILDRLARPEARSGLQLPRGS